MNATHDLSFAIRPEQPDDKAAIHDLTRRAFAPMSFADGDEQDLIDALRDAGVLSISLVAERNGRVLGHVAFSPAIAADGAGAYYVLGPVCVEPDLQQQGIGSVLISAGLEMLRERGAAGCVLVGSMDYYPRFGFNHAPEHCPDGEPADHYQMLCFDGAVPDGIIGFHPLFHGEYK